MNPIISMEPDQIRLDAASLSLSWCLADVSLARTLELRVKHSLDGDTFRVFRYVDGERTELYEPSAFEDRIEDVIEHERGLMGWDYEHTVRNLRARGEERMTDDESEAVGRLRRTWAAFVRTFNPTATY